MRVGDFWRTPVSICVHRQIPQILVRSAMGDEGILDWIGDHSIFGHLFVAYVRVKEW